MDESEEYHTSGITTLVRVRCPAYLDSKHANSNINASKEQTVNSFMQKMNVIFNLSVPKMNVIFTSMSFQHF